MFFTCTHLQLARCSHLRCASRIERGKKYVRAESRLQASRSTYEGNMSLSAVTQGNMSMAGSRSLSLLRERESTFGFLFCHVALKLYDV